MTDSPEEPTAEAADAKTQPDEPESIDRKRRRKDPSIEAGEAPDEMTTTITPARPEDLAEVGDMADPAEPPPTTKDLTGPEVAEIRTRNDAIDRAREEAQSLRKSAQSIAEDAERMDDLARYSQEALSAAINNLISTSGLDPSYRYSIDLKRGRIVPAGRL